MPIITIVMPETFTPLQIAADFESVSNVKVSDIVLRRDGFIDIHYEESEERSSIYYMDLDGDYSYDHYKECDMCGKERSLNDEGYCSRCWQVWNS